MTYIKPEINPSQLPTSVSQVLYMGLAAAQQQDWLSVCDCLKQLPQTKSRKKPKQFVLTAKDWQAAQAIAFGVLIEADFQHKWAISKLIPLFGNEIVPLLTALVKDRTVEADVRWFVCRILGQFKSEEVAIALVELLQQATDRELVEIAGKTLSEIGDDAVAALSSLIAQPEYSLLAVQSLFYIRTAKTIEPLLEVTSHPDPQLRAIAIKALGSFHDRRIAPVLIRALQDKASKVRIEAAIALGFRSDLADELDLTSHLSLLLSDFNLEVCRQAATSLGRMKQEAANQALFKALQAETTPINLKLDLVKALGWSELKSEIDYLDRALANSSETVVREIITILGRVSVLELKPLATQVLLNFWQTSRRELTPQLKQSLATSLGELRCRDAKATLEQLARDSDRKIQLHAKSALKKISIDS